MKTLIRAEENKQKGRQFDMPDLHLNSSFLVHILNRNWNKCPDIKRCDRIILFQNNIIQIKDNFLANSFMNSSMFQSLNFPTNSFC